MSASTHQPTVSTPVGSPVAIVTGASQGLGLALAEGLAERGWALVVDARRATVTARVTNSARGAVSRTQSSSSDQRAGARSVAPTTNRHGVPAWA